MTDIVKRLQDDIRVAETGVCECYVSTMAEAKSEIERLRAEAYEWRERAIFAEKISGVKKIP